MQSLPTVGIESKTLPRNRRKIKATVYPSGTVCTLKPVNLQWGLQATMHSDDVEA